MALNQLESLYYISPSILSDSASAWIFWMDLK